MRAALAGSGFVSVAAVLTLAAVAPSSASAATGTQIVNTAKLYMGRPYRFGVDMSVCPRYFDCSAFTKYVYAKYGYYLPRASRDQATRGRWVSRSSLRAGDLVFFNVTSRPGIDHVAIYMGGNRIIHTYGSPGVCTRYLSGTFWGRHVVTCRRILR